LSLSSYFSSAQTLYKKRLQYLESRISQSSCVPKRDFTAYFDDAERFNEQKCLALFRFKMEDINTMVELLGLNGMTFRLSNRAKYTGKEGFLVLLAHLTRASEFVGLIEEGFTYGSVPAGSQLANEIFGLTDLLLLFCRVSFRQLEIFSRINNLTFQARTTSLQNRYSYLNAVRRSISASSTP